MEKVNFYVSDKIGEAVEFKTEFFDKESSLLMIEKDEKENQLMKPMRKFLNPRLLTLLSSDLMEKY